MVVCTRRGSGAVEAWQWCGGVLEGWQWCGGVYEAWQWCGGGVVVVWWCVGGVAVVLWCVRGVAAVYGTSLRDSRCVPAYGRTPSVCCCWGVYAISRPEQGSIGISFWPFNPGRKFGRRRSELCP